jgi:hypothetical protein
MAEDASALWIGGGLALAGTALGLVGSLVAGWLERKNQRDRLLRERYEEMTQAIAATLPWFARLAACRNLDEVRLCPPPAESRRLVILSLVYFPEFKDVVAEYHNELIEHFGNAVDCCADRLVGGASIGAIMAKRGHKSDGFTHLRQRLDNLVEKYAAKYTKA